MTEKRETGFTATRRKLLKVARAGASVFGLGSNLAFAAEANDVSTPEAAQK